MISLQYTFVIGIFSGFCSIVLSYCFITLDFISQKKRNYFQNFIFDVMVNLPLMISPMIVFMCLFPFFNLYNYGKNTTIFLLIIVHSIICLPIIYKILHFSVIINKNKYLKLSKSFNLSLWQNFKYIDWPIIQKYIGYCLGTSTIFVMGDLKTMLFVNNTDVATLPIIIYDKLTSYNIDDAISICALTILLIYFILIFFQKKLKVS